MTEPRGKNNIQALMGIGITAECSVNKYKLRKKN